MKHYLQERRTSWKVIKEFRGSHDSKRTYKHGIDTATARGMTSRDYVRELVRTRDKWTCQACSKLWKEGTRRFDVHHLDGLCGKMSQGVDRVPDIPKLMTLCHKCHFNHPQHYFGLTIHRQTKML